jgi:hypothetical protein
MITRLRSHDSWIYLNNSYTRRANRSTQRNPLATKTLYAITTVIIEEVIEVRTQRKPLATKTLYPITVILEELIEDILSYTRFNDKVFGRFIADWSIKNTNSEATPKRGVVRYLCIAKKKFKYNNIFNINNIVLW